jgi:dihydropteroate synthase
VTPDPHASTSKHATLKQVRKNYFWKLADRELRLGDRTIVMGVLNVTPDSFSDGGKYADPDRAFARAIELEEQGADIIDIGAESTKPGSDRITAAVELQRLVPVLKRLKDALSIPISIDTYKAEVAERALELGAAIINDPSGLTFEPQLARTVSNHNAGLVINHMRGRPETWAKLGPMPDPIATIGRDLDAAVSRARHVGVDKTRIVVDPGLGFGKRKEQNSVILARLHEFGPLDLPVMTGPSRKSFLAHPDPEENRFATAAAVAASILGGAHVVRVHEVREMRAVADVVDEILRGRVDHTIDTETHRAAARPSPRPR